MTYHGPLGTPRTTPLSQNNPTKDILELKDHLVNVERTVNEIIIYWCLKQDCLRKCQQYSELLNYFVFRFVLAFLLFSKSQISNANAKSRKLIKYSFKCSAFVSYLLINIQKNLLKIVPQILKKKIIWFPKNM